MRDGQQRDGGSRNERRGETHALRCLTRRAEWKGPVRARPSWNDKRKFSTYLADWGFLRAIVKWLIVVLDGDNETSPKQNVIFLG